MIEQPPAGTVRLVLPWTTPPLSLNRVSGNRYAHARLVRKVRGWASWAAAAARAQLVGDARLQVQLVYRPARRGRRDTDNLVATLKPCCDGLVDAGVVPDDTPEHMAKPEPLILDPAPSQRTGQLWLDITPLPSSP